MREQKVLFASSPQGEQRSSKGCSWKILKREEVELTLLIDLPELRIMRRFKPRRMPAAAPNKSAAIFWARGNGPEPCTCDNSRKTLITASKKESSTRSEEHT